MHTRPAQSKNIPWASAHSHVFPVPGWIGRHRSLALSLWWHRKAKLHVSFSYRGKPQHRLPLFSLICGCFTGPLFLLFAQEGKSKSSLFLSHALKSTAAEVKRKGPINRAYQMTSYCYVWNPLHDTGWTGIRSYLCSSRNDNISASDGVYQRPQDHSHCYSGEYSVGHHCHGASHHCCYRYVHTHTQGVWDARSVLRHPVRRCVSVPHRWARFGWELSQPNRDGPHLPIGSLDPRRSPLGYCHLPDCGDTHQQEKEVGADVVLQCPKEGEKLTLNLINQLVLLKQRLKTVHGLQASATTSDKAVMT